MYRRVKETILKKVQIPDEALEKSFEFSSVQLYKKGDRILKAGEYCRFIGFVNSGLIVTTILSEGKEIACNFIYEGCFFPILKASPSKQHHIKTLLP